MPTELERRARELPNEHGFEQWYTESAFDYERNPIGSYDCDIARRAWHAALAALQAQQPGAQAVAWIVRSDKLADAVTIYKGEAQTLARVRDGGSYAPLFTHPQPPSTPEPSGGDVDEAVAAFNESYLDDGSTKRAAIRAALTTYTARLRESLK